jgi:hypothetical protein
MSPLFSVSLRLVRGLLLLVSPQLTTLWLLVAVAVVIIKEVGRELVASVLAQD